MLSSPFSTPAVSMSTGDPKESLRVCFAGMVELRELGKPLREVGAGRTWT